VYVEKSHKTYLGDTKPNQRVTDLLSESEKAIREGNSQYAYELSLQATQAAPENLDAWLMRATLAPSLEERIICVNHLNELMPDHQDKHHIAFFTIKELLDKNPFLAYLEETEDLYRVVDADHMVLAIPKKRAALSSSPSEQVNPLRAANRWLFMAIIGLMLAGIGTLLFAPLAALAALRVGPFSQSRADRVGSTIVFLLAVILFLVGALFTFLFVLHLTG
jgi:hypothetical protein